MLGTVAASLALLSTATAQTITDPTGSVSVGTDGSNADASLVAISDSGCARSGLIAVAGQYTVAPSRYCERTYDAEGPIAVSYPSGNARGTIVVADYGADGSCWNPVGVTGCLPTVAHGGHGSGTVVVGTYDTTASDWGPVPGVAVSWGNGAPHTEDDVSGSIAVTLGATARGRLVAVSKDQDAYADPSDPSVAVSVDGHACGGSLATISVNGTTC